ncbi:MAG: UTP--glucose-1-phosphate uridylyltransferase [Deltaproteobacteria bacterium]|nr:UTP--glucose-1-phosphate uridylyltransferase [Deltaproteobacteria bacterium]
MKKVKKAIIPAAGRGTRLLPITKIVCKELVPILDRPTVDYAVSEIQASGMTHIVFVTSDKEGAIKNYFLEDSTLKQYLEEKNRLDLIELLPNYTPSLSFDSVHQPLPSGLGAAVLQAQSAIGEEPFAVTLGDDIIDAQVPVLKQLTNVFDDKKHSVISVMEVSQAQVPMYGIVEGELIGDRLYKINRVIEKPSPHQTKSRLAIIGRYIFTPNLFECLKQTPKGKGGEIQLTDAVALLLQNEPIYAYKFKGTRIDAGDKLGLLKAHLYFGAKELKWKKELKTFFDSLYS